MKKIYYIIALLLVSMFFVSCHNDNQAEIEATPTSVANAFNQAILNKKYKKALALTDSPKEEQKLAIAWMQMMFDEMDNTTITVISEKIDSTGNGAIVQNLLTHNGETDTLYTRVVKINGLWKVRLVADF